MTVQFHKWQSETCPRQKNSIPCGAPKNFLLSDGTVRYFHRDSEGKDCYFDAKDCETIREDTPVRYTTQSTFVCTVPTNQKIPLYDSVTATEPCSFYQLIASDQATHQLVCTAKYVLLDGTTRYYCPDISGGLYLECDSVVELGAEDVAIKSLSAYACTYGTDGEVVLKMYWDVDINTEANIIIAPLIECLDDSGKVVQSYFRNDGTASGDGWTEGFVDAGKSYRVSLYALIEGKQNPEDAIAKTGTITITIPEKEVLRCSVTRSRTVGSENALKLSIQYDGENPLSVYRIDKGRKETKLVQTITPVGTGETMYCYDWPPYDGNFAYYAVDQQNQYCSGTPVAYLFSIIKGATATEEQKEYLNEHGSSLTAWCETSDSSIKVCWKNIPNPGDSTLYNVYRREIYPMEGEWALMTEWGYSAYEDVEIVTYEDTKAKPNRTYAYYVQIGAGRASSALMYASTDPTNPGVESLSGRPETESGTAGQQLLSGAAVNGQLGCSILGGVSQDAVVYAAQYQDGKLLAVKSTSVTASDAPADLSFLFPYVDGAEYKLFLLGDHSVPMCENWKSDEQP